MSSYWIRCDAHEVEQWHVALVEKDWHETIVWVNPHEYILLTYECPTNNHNTVYVIRGSEWLWELGE